MSLCFFVFFLYFFVFFVSFLYFCVFFVFLFSWRNATQWPTKRSEP